MLTRFRNCFRNQRRSKPTTQRRHFVDSVEHLGSKGVVDFATYASLLRKCGNARNLYEGKRIHAHIEGGGKGGDRFLGNLLVEMYGKCGSLQDARVVFEGIRRRNVFSWTIMIAAYAQNGHPREALELFQKMQRENVKPTDVTFLSVIGACLLLGDLAEGKAIHAEIVANCFEKEIAVGNALVNMYGKCRSLDDARKIFDKMPHRDVVSWTSIIAAYAELGHPKQALELYNRMQQDGVKPNDITYVSLLNTAIESTDRGKVIEEHITESCLDSHVVVVTALIDMHTRCGELDQARSLFEKLQQKDVITWTTMIAAYAQHGHPKLALELYHEMDRKGVMPNEVTFVSALGACSSLEAVAEGKAIHDRIMRNAGFDSNLVLGTALVNMYGKCGSLQDARSVFNSMPHRDLFLWNTMIAAYAEHGHCRDALELYQQMDLQGVKPDEVTFASILDACATVGGATEAKAIHARIVLTGIMSNNAVGAALVDMYAKSGSLSDAKAVFDSLKRPNMVTWTAIISAYARAGRGSRALELYQQMGLEGVEPDSVTYLSILSGCCHAGLLDESQHYFVSMIQDYHFTATTEQCVCMVDILGRSGRLEDAEKLIHKMPFQPKSVAWKALLGACRVQNDVQRGARVAQLAFELDSKDSAPYVLLSNIYAAAGS